MPRRARRFRFKALLPKPWLTPRRHPPRRSADLSTWTTLRPVRCIGGRRERHHHTILRCPLAKGAQPLPLNAQAFAALQEADEISEREKLALAENRGWRLPAAPAPRPPPSRRLRSTNPKAGGSRAGESRRASSRLGWVIQLGATDDEEKAQAVLDRAGKILPKASPFTEKVTVRG